MMPDGLIADIGKALIGMGPGGVLALIFWRQWQASDAERKELQKLLFDLGKSSVEGDLKVAEAINGIRQEMAAGRAK